MDRLVGLHVDLRHQRLSRQHLDSGRIQQVDLAVGRQGGEYRGPAVERYEFQRVDHESQLGVCARLDFAEDNRLAEIGEIEQIDGFVALEQDLLRAVTTDQDRLRYVQFDCAELIGRLVGEQQRDGSRLRLRLHG
jgi:hypothetical protein